MFLAEIAKSGSKLLPVDSEHNAIFQLIAHEDTPIERLLLTASGGPFRTWTREQMAAASPKQAVAHPNWSMGARISIDSASMFNKALEMIEAGHLFDITPDRIEVVVHPQSIIHSMIGYRDGSILAHLGPSDMRVAIGYALAWPERPDLPVERLDFAKLARLDFEAPDEERFPPLRLAREAMRAGGQACCVMNAAHEVALDAFIAGQIGFLDMAGLVEATLSALDGMKSASSLDDVFQADSSARDTARRLLVEHMSKGRFSLELIESIPVVGPFFATVVPFLACLSIVVAIHELGHLMVGRWCGIKAEVYSVGFGKVLYSRKDSHGTVWQLAMWPLGGFVKFVGDMDPSSSRRASGRGPAAGKAQVCLPQRGAVEADADRCGRDRRSTSCCRW